MSHNDFGHAKITALKIANTLMKIDDDIILEESKEQIKEGDNH
jgi:hypothetical protein